MPTDLPDSPVLSDRPRAAWAVPVYVGLSLVSGVGIGGKLPLLARLLHLPHAGAAVFAGLLFGLPFLWRVALRYSRLVAPLFFLGILVVSFAVYPKVAALHAEGRGSDQADCVIVAAGKLAAGRWPYDGGSLWSGHAMSCGPGWVMLQTPVIRWASYRIDLILLWTLSLLTLARTIGRARTLELAALLALAPVVWLASANGSDFLTFGIVLAAVVAAAEAPGTPRTLALLAGVLVVQFRPPMLLLPGFLRQALGRTRALGLGLVAILLQFAFVAIAPRSFLEDGPFSVWWKLMRIEVLYDRPMLLGSLLTAGLILGLLVALRVGRFCDPVTSSLSFLVLLLGTMAAVNLAARIHVYGVDSMALRLWEGGMWLSACLPLAALAVVRRAR